MRPPELLRPRRRSVSRLRVAAARATFLEYSQLRITWYHRGLLTYFLPPTRSHFARVKFGPTRRSILLYRGKVYILNFFASRGRIN